MIQNAWNWADQQAGRKRRNPVHGEEEIRFVLNDTFEWMEEEGEEMCQEGGIEMEDPTYKTIENHLHSQKHFLPTTSRAGRGWNLVRVQLASGGWQQ